MYKNILIPVALDHIELIPDKIALARRLLAEGGRITVVTVLEGIPGYVSEFVTVKSENHLTESVRRKLADAVGGAPDVGTEILTGKAGVEITQYARDTGVDLIVIGSHRPGIQDYFLGSTAARVVRRAGCTVMVVRPDGAA
ncbi:universal stress protein [Rhodovulum sp. YNF3179]|uniref:universal stress protein n=1 Tax=Rhodovulum sp. YNF3179 TaxID=3425127 RepID=UPI003D345809